MSIPDDVRDRISLALKELPVLKPKDLLNIEDSCPICLASFASIFEDVDPEAGVTKLVACNHVFCRKDLTQWIMSLHGNCPTCRNIFLDIRLPSDSDDESSDGGEYVPDDDFDEDEDDGFVDNEGFSDALDHLSEEMETDSAIEWDDAATDLDLADMDDLDAAEYMDDDDDLWGLTDGESSHVSESEGADDAAMESEGGIPLDTTTLDIELNLAVQDDPDVTVLSQLGQEEK
ncbi:hypothetical protein H0H81_007922 [Sphagnurus paluster]|uniref:RING-type domain-containing protein n=1 Tax=Sphagnurus paluster TaxID=117069 RepID=A0A9P7K7D6_9AGAR|nr:hypothetical protein H0H81_007922 [Sphagnurus paluster]